eukprot:m.396469 g.396469  ORF g.396469 m.396469 type:complete len:377 (+) comp21109_c1_seq1:168-1298(+)
MVRVLSPCVWHRLGSIVSMRKFASSQIPLSRTAHRQCSQSAEVQNKAFDVAFTGVWPIMATPFCPDESIDEDSFRRSVEFMRDCGADGITILGVMGESNRMLDSERERLIRVGIAAAGSMPVCVGTSHPGTTAAVGLTEMAADLGASAVMITPYKEAIHSDENIRNLYTSVAHRLPDLPIVLQDHPMSTQVNMTLSLIADIARDVPSVRCIKLESTPTPVRTAGLIKLMESSGVANRPTILTGLGALYGGYELAAGADGFMTGFAFPEVLKVMVETFKPPTDNGVRSATMEAEMMSVYKQYLPLIVLEQQPGVAVRKYIYEKRGMIDCGIVRSPGGNLSSAAREITDKALRDAFGDADLTKPLDWKRSALFSLPLA